MKTPIYTRLTFEERVIISTLREQGHKRSQIAKHLKRARSTIGNELNLWVKNSSHKYEAKKAHDYAKEVLSSKRCRSKISDDPYLAQFVHTKLKAELSPETIAGRIQVEYPTNSTMRVSHETIYKYIYTLRDVLFRKELISYLLLSRPKRRRNRGIKKRGSRIVNAISIEARPKHIELREEAGHWEGDLMIGKGQGSAIGTLVERKSRYTLITKLANKKTETVTLAFKNALSKMKPIFRKTMTYDNGLEMAKHEWFTKQTGMNVYFAHPYSSWERGTNENTNGIIRRSFPKKTDFSQVTEEQLKFVENKLNNTPRKVLQFLTPLEVMRMETIKNM